MLHRIRLYVETAALFACTIAALSYTLGAHALRQPDALNQPQLSQKPSNSLASHPTQPAAAMSGAPTHISIPSYQIELPVDPGTYDESSGAWTLSDTTAQFADITMPANSQRGTTLIYGHATELVFGRLAATPPQTDTPAIITTDSGHQLTYTFTHSQTLAPSDTTLFDDVTSGPPTLVVQTCTGTFSEWRTMYYFNFSEMAAA